MADYGRSGRSDPPPMTAEGAAISGSPLDRHRAPWLVSGLRRTGECDCWPSGVAERAACSSLPSDVAKRTADESIGVTRVALVPQAAARKVTPRLLVGVAAAMVAAQMAGVGAQPATAAPESDIATVRARVERLQHEAEVASEKYNDVREQLKSLDVRVKAAQTRLGLQQANLASARRVVGQLAAESYRGGDFATLELYLGDDPDAMLTRAGVVETLADRQVQAVTRLRDAQRQLASGMADLGRQKAKVTASRAALAASKKDVEAKLAEARGLLSRLSGAQRRALERASRDAERKAARDAQSQAPADSGDTAGGIAMTCGGVAVKAPTARVKAVLDYACAQLGDPYQWGADGPDSFDCSGLTMQAWARGGVSLPHSSKMQVGYGTRVSASNLRPGDLVFFYSPISHVAIYIGKGMMVTAPQTGDTVRVKAVMYSNLVAAVRL